MPSLRTLGVLLVSVGCLSATLLAQKPVASYSAFAINMSGDSGAQTASLDIDIQRWSTDAELGKFFDVLKEQGAAKARGKETPVSKHRVFSVLGKVEEASCF